MPAGTPWAPQSLRLAQPIGTWAVSRLAHHLGQCLSQNRHSLTVATQHAAVPRVIEVPFG